MAKKTPVKRAATKKKVEKDITDSFLLREKPEELKIREFPWTEKQKKLIELLSEKKTNVCFISGPAGCSKTLVATYVGLKLLQEKKTSEITYIRSSVESSTKSIGFLPGSLEEKVNPYFQALIDKCDELLPTNQVNELTESGSIKGISNQFLRGVQWRNYIIIDECQDFDIKELTTIMTRLASGGTLVFAGDPLQSDIGNKSGFMKFFNLFNNEESRAKGIHTFEFTKEDIKRSPILAFVCEKIETLK